MVEAKRAGFNLFSPIGAIGAVVGVAFALLQIQAILNERLSHQLRQQIAATEPVIIDTEQDGSVNRSNNWAKKLLNSYYNRNDASRAEFIDSLPVMVDLSESELAGSLSLSGSSLLRMIASYQADQGDIQAATATIAKIKDVRERDAAWRQMATKVLDKIKVGPQPTSTSPADSAATDSQIRIATDYVARIQDDGFKASLFFRIAKLDASLNRDQARQQAMERAVTNAVAAQATPTNFAAPIAGAKVLDTSASDPKSDPPGKTSGGEAAQGSFAPPHWVDALGWYYVPIAGSVAWLLACLLKPILEALSGWLIGLIGKA
jgi:hypothetical protein